jgi:hypothetical protein
MMHTMTQDHDRSERRALGTFPSCSESPTFRRVGHFCLPVAFVASPDLHGRFKCCPDSHSTSAFLIYVYIYTGRSDNGIKEE